MEPLVQKLESQLATLPVSLSIALPGGRRIGPANAAVQLEHTTVGEAERRLKQVLSEIEAEEGLFV